MTEIFEDIILAVFAFGAGFFFAENALREKEKEKEDFIAGTDKNFFSAVNNKNPTIPQQMINIMNYNGEDQTEENYE